MENANITFIGSGNMAGSLVGGLIADGCDPARIRVTDTDQKRREHLQERFGVRAEADNRQAVAGADALVTACPMCMANVDGRQLYRGGPPFRRPHDVTVHYEGTAVAMVALALAESGAAERLAAEITSYSGLSDIDSGVTKGKEQIDFRLTGLGRAALDGVGA